MRGDFILSVPRDDITDVTESPSIKRELYHAMPWISDYCKDRKLIERERLPRDTERLIYYFKDILREEGEDIHDFAGAKLENVDQYNIQVRFMAYRYE